MSAYRKFQEVGFRIGGGSIAGGLLGLLATILLPEVYRAEVKMLPAERQNAGAGAAGMLSEFGAIAAGIAIGDNSPAKAAALEILRSRSLARRFISENGLESALAVDENESERLGEAVRIFDRSIRRVSEDRRTGIITLAIEWTDRQSAARWANDLVALLNEQMRSEARRTAARNLEFLEHRLTGTETLEIRQSMYELIERQLTAAMMAEVNQDYALVVIDPAMVPDERSYVRPLKAVWALGGAALGFLVVGSTSALRARRGGLS